MSISIKEFRDFKTNYCDTFFPSDVTIWSSIVLLECMDNPSLMAEVKEYLTIKEDINANELNDLMQKLRDKTNKYIDMMNRATTKDEAYEIFRKSLVYYGILESLDELASFSSNLISQIKDKYKDNYLEVIANFDKGNLSVDGSKVLENMVLPEEYNDDELLKKYRVLKIWQDKQHGYYQTIIEPILQKMAEYYWDMYPNSLDVHFESPVMYLKFYQLCQKDLISIDELSKLYLCGIDKELIKLVGGKGYGLTVLNAKGIEIPKTYVIPCFTSSCDIHNWTELNSNIHYSVRSSADIEDGQKNSFAGLFDSYLDVDYKSLNEYIAKVIASKDNIRVQEYITHNNLTQPNMAVLLQPFQEPTFAGVWIGKDSNSGYLEYVKGNGEKLVSGKVTPKMESWDNHTNTTDKLKCQNGFVGEKLIEYQKLLSDDNPADFEWMILNDKLVLLQYRPVTTKLEIPKDINLEEKGVYKGIAASPGFASGPARFINARYIDKVDDWKDGDILIAWYTDPEWMNILSHSSGIVTAVGGFLCHAAIIARELGIPCVIGIGGDAMKKIWNEKELIVDGTNGLVKTTLIRKRNSR